jgi:hypothetical protein
MTTDSKKTPTFDIIAEEPIEVSVQGRVLTMDGGEKWLLVTASAKTEYVFGIPWDDTIKASYNNIQAAALEVLETELRKALVTIGDESAALKVSKEPRNVV